MIAPLAALSLLTATMALADEPPSPPVVKPEPATTPVPASSPTPTETTSPSATTTVVGTVREIDVEPRRMVVGRAEGNVTVLLDRNTQVYREQGTGTLRDVHAGAPVRVSVTNADQRALWVELTAPSGEQPGARKDLGGAGVPPTNPDQGRQASPQSPVGPGPVPGGAAGSQSTTGTAPAH